MKTREPLKYNRFILSYIGIAHVVVLVWNCYPQKVPCALEHRSPGSIDLHLVSPLGEVAGEGVGEGADVGEGDEIVPEAVPACINTSMSDELTSQKMFGSVRCCASCFWAGWSSFGQGGLEYNGTLYDPWAWSKFHVTGIDLWRRAPCWLVPDQSSPAASKGGLGWPPLGDLSRGCTWGQLVVIFQKDFFKRSRIGFNLNNRCHCSGQKSPSTGQAGVSDN